MALDDGYETDAAVANTRRLIENEKVFALMGFYGSSPTAAVLPLLDASGVPLVGTISGAEALRRPMNRHMFHLRASYGDETAEIVKNLTTVAVTRIAGGHGVRAAQLGGRGRRGGRDIEVRCAGGGDGHPLPPDCRIHQAHARQRRVAVLRGAVAGGHRPADRRARA